MELGSGTGIYGREFSVSGFNAGAYTLTARYTGNNYFASVTSSPAQTLTVEPIKVHVSVGATSTMTVNGTQNLSASVTPAGAPGTIQFKVNGENHGTPVTLSGSTASSPWTPTSTGPFTVTAMYIPANGNYAPDAANPPNTVTVTVSAILTSVSVSAPASTEYGKSTNLAATVLPAAAPGTVQFKLNGVNYGNPVTVSGGSATLAWIPDVLGTDIAVTASFASGSANYLSDLDSNSVPVDVTAAAVTITISAAAGVTVGDSINLNAELKPSAAPGTVRFFADGSEVSGSGGVAADTTDGVTTFSWTPSSVGDGTATISATYTSSSSNYASQANSANDDVAINKAASSVSEVTVTPSSVTAGTSVSLSATVTVTGGGQVPTCSACLQFRLGSTTGTALGAAADVTSTGTITAVVVATGGSNTLDVGSHTIYAVYSGTAYVSGSSGNASLTVDPVALTVSITSPTTPATHKKNTALSLSVTLSPGTAPGTIAVYQDGVAVGASVTVTGGAMTISWNAPNDNNTYSLTVVYTSSDNDYQSSATSGAVSVQLTN